MKTESIHNNLKIFPITAYVVAYPLLLSLSTLIAAFALKLGGNISKNIIIFFVAMAWIPSVIFFIRDQRRLYSYMKSHVEFKSIFYKRLILFLLIYPLVVLWMWAFVYDIFEFIRKGI